MMMGRLQSEAGQTLDENIVCHEKEIGPDNLYGPFQCRI